MAKYLIISYSKLHGHPLDEIPFSLVYVSVFIKKEQEGKKSSDFKC